jgi:hypothetical protein
MLLVFALTLFTSATLLFLVQPMIGKMILPLLGGSPEVWNTCLVFFQAMLLAGYAYAHASTRWLGVRRQAGYHLAVLVLPVLLFAVAGPLVVHRSFIVGGGNPIAGVLLILLVAVGLPFFVVSTTSPLLQQWFSSTDHPSARDPYFLSTASNFGSMLALVGYPALVEPFLTLKDQRLAWSIGYGVYILLTGTCAVLLWRSGVSATASGLEPALAAEPVKALAAVGTAAITADEPRSGKVQAGKPRGRGRAKKGDKPERVEQPPPENEPASDTALSGEVTVGRRVRWVLMAAVPSSLMMGVTTFVTMDLAPIPLLWVLPLGLYLLSFIIVFAKIPEKVQSTLVVAGVLLMLCGVAAAASSWLSERSGQVQFLAGLCWLAAVGSTFLILSIRDANLIHKVMILAMPLLVLLLVFMMLSKFELKIGYVIVLHLLLMFVVAMVCHGAIVRDRPPTKYLTEFYMWMSFGGVLGGIFNALIAPVIFNSLAEYALAMVVACMLLPALDPNEDTDPGKLGRYADVALIFLFILAGGCLAGCRLVNRNLDFETLRNGGWGWMAAAVVLTLGFGFVYALRPARGRLADFALRFPVALLVFGLALAPLAVLMGMGLADDRWDYLLVLRGTWGWLLAAVALSALWLGFAKLRSGAESRTLLGLRDALPPGLVVLAIILSGLLIAATVFARIHLQSDLLDQLRSRLIGFDGLAALRDGCWVWLVMAAVGGVAWGANQLRGAASEDRATAGPRAAWIAVVCGLAVVGLGALTGYSSAGTGHDLLAVRKGGWAWLLAAAAGCLIAGGVLVSRVPIADRLRVGLKVVLPATLAVLALVPAAFLLGLVAGDPQFSGEALSGRGWHWLIGASGLILCVAALFPLIVRNCRLRQFTPSLDIALPIALLLLTIGLVWGLRSTVLHYRIIAFASSLGFDDERQLRVILTFGLPAVLCYTFVERSLKFGLGIGAVLLGGAFTNLLVDPTLYEHRSYFGVLKVEVRADPRRDVVYVRRDVPSALLSARLEALSQNDEAIMKELDEGRPVGLLLTLNELLHGTTVHGMQYQMHQMVVPLMAAETVGAGCGDPLGLATVALATTTQDYSEQALTYYHRAGPMGRVMREFNRSAADRIGVIGLGTGTLACYGRPGQTMVFYDIDKAVKEISFDRRDYFSFICDAKARGVNIPDLVLGDARLEIERFLTTHPDLPESEKYTILVVDAFSSDAIPLHLITREAVQQYMKLLRGEGVLAFHVSNRFLDLKPVLANIAEEEGLVAAFQSEPDGLLDLGTIGRSGSTWVVIARATTEPSEAAPARVLHSKTLEPLMTEERRSPSKEHAQDRNKSSFPEGAKWERAEPKPGTGVWTDDYSNLIKVLSWRDVIGGW